MVMLLNVHSYLSLLLPFILPLFRYFLSLLLLFWSNGIEMANPLCVIVYIDP